MIAIPNMEKPQNITRCSYKINPEECKCVYTDKVFEETLALLVDHPCPDCPLIEIVECKDCKYWTDDMSGNMWCEHAIGGLTEPTDFCSYGDRIDEYEKEYRELGLYELRELRKGERRADET